MDKVQKILSEIATRKLCSMDEHMAFYNDKAKEDYRFLSEIEEFIKASQEEPVSNVWHDAKIDTPQAKKKILATNEYGACEVDYAINMALYWPKVIKWAYIDDLLNLDNSCQSCNKMVSDAIDATIGLPYENKDGGYTHLVDVSRPLPVGEHKIAIIFKEDLL